jgi:hypothetical protein
MSLIKDLASLRSVIGTFFFLAPFLPPQFFQNSPKNNLMEYAKKGEILAVDLSRHSGFEIFLILFYNKFSSDLKGGF